MQLILCSFLNHYLENCTVSAARDEMKLLTYNAKSHFLLTKPDRPMQLKSQATVNLESKAFVFDYIYQKHSKFVKQLQNMPDY